MEPKYEGRKCYGMDLRSFYAEKPKLKGRINLAWLIMTYRNMHSDPDFFTEYFDLLAGNSLLRDQIIHELPEQAIKAEWLEGIQKFRAVREKYLLYPE
jgi:uncharacterized protein YbbC (DUF1343 family)